ncbi:MAG: acylphosphatase [Gemmatimonadota bacterium]|nr:MAG: acylphosphatase [Gemmatimonadota bacterium]
MKSRAHIFVSGVVQGVYYRDFTQSHATAMELTGWVRNIDDGRVEITVEGERDRIDHLVERLRSGPPASRVDDVQVDWEEYSGGFSNFQVRYS